MEQQSPEEFKSLSPNFPGKSLSSICSSSLFSTIVSLYALILLYFPSLFFHIIFSPIFILTGILFLSLLRLSAFQRTECNSHCIQTPHESNTTIPSFSPRDDPKLFYSDSFREWNVRAPLEVIYEEYGEGEDEDDDDKDEDDNAGVFNKKIERRVLGIDEKYPISLSMYYPESDSDSDSSSEGGNWETSEGAFFQWNEEDREELIEIALDGKRDCGNDCRVIEEDNMIEIDIFPARD